MSDFQTEMNRSVQMFVAQITELARRAAIETLESAFGERAARGGGAAAVAILDGAGRVGRPRGGRGAKRTAADLEALSEKVEAFIKASPGLRIEQINKELSTTTKDLALPDPQADRRRRDHRRGSEALDHVLPGRQEAQGAAQEAQVSVYGPEQWSGRGTGAALARHCRTDYWSRSGAQVDTPAPVIRYGRCSSTVRYVPVARSTARTVEFSALSSSPYVVTKT